jgi:hypothetical protein
MINHPRSSAHRPLKSREHKTAEPLREAVEARVFENLPGEPKLEQTPVQQPPATPTTSRADRLEAAINEIEALVSDRWPISRQVMDVIKRVRSS